MRLEYEPAWKPADSYGMQAAALREGAAQAIRQGTQEYL